jgi:hypothetical protein
VTGSTTMLFVVLEEVYSIAPDGGERELLSCSPRPLFAGDRQAAQWYAKNRAAEFDAADYHDEADDPYFWGRDAVKGESHRFIVKPAMPA